MSIDPITTTTLEEPEVPVVTVAEVEVKPKKKKKKKNKKKDSRRNSATGISKETIGLVRTNLRNNVDLTNIADNKANVLLSLNAIMLTFFIPFAISGIDIIVEKNLVIPILLLVLTSLITIFLAVIALRPGKSSGQTVTKTALRDFSPFFFGNLTKLTKMDYVEFLESTLRNDKEVISFMTSDFYHIGLRLGEKMGIVRRAFNIFITGLCTSVILAIIILLINQ